MESVSRQPLSKSEHLPFRPRRTQARREIGDAQGNHSRVPTPLANSSNNPWRTLTSISSIAARQSLRVTAGVINDSAPDGIAPPNLLTKTPVQRGVQSIGH